MSSEKISGMGAFIQFDRKKYEQQGLGLGITIVKRLMKVYNGDMRIESAPNEFSRVTVSIPL